MALVRSAVLASVFAGFLFACSSPEPTSLDKTDSADQADDDDDSTSDGDSEPSTSSKKSSSTDDEPAPAPAKTTPATTTTTPAKTTTSTSSGSLLDKLPFKLSDLLALLQGAGNNNGGAGGFDLGGLFGGLFGNGGGGADLGGVGGLAGSQTLLGAPDDSTGCCVGTQFFICGANATTCSNATKTCERAADLDDVCAQ